jgi:hypothetical protein
MQIAADTGAVSQSRYDQIRRAEILQWPASEILKMHNPTRWQRKIATAMTNPTGRKRRRIRNQFSGMHLRRSSAWSTAWRAADYGSDACSRSETLDVFPGKSLFNVGTVRPQGMIEGMIYVAACRIADSEALPFLW